MKLTLTRHYLGFIDNGGYRWPTMGSIALPFARLPIGAQHKLFTLEDPWNDNKQGDSCIPDGLYTLDPHSTDAHPNTWAMVNPDLNIHHWPTNGGRYACLIHTGNWEDDVQGCILVGLRQIIMRDKVHGRAELAVSSSNDAMDLLRKVLGPGVHQLEIRTTPGAILEFTP